MNDLDKTVAIEVFECKTAALRRVGDIWVPVCRCLRKPGAKWPHGRGDDGLLRRYGSDPTEAMRVVGRVNEALELVARIEQIVPEAETDAAWFCEFVDPHNGAIGGASVGDTFAEAVCKAALEAFKRRMIR